MKLPIYRSPHAEATMTNETPTSHYGQPVLRIRFLSGQLAGQEEDYGPADLLPSRLLAADLVAHCLRATDDPFVVPIPPEHRAWVQSFIGPVGPSPGGPTA